MENDEKQARAATKAGTENEKQAAAEGRATGVSLLLRLMMLRGTTWNCYYTFMLELLLFIITRKAYIASYHFTVLNALLRRMCYFHAALRVSAFYSDFATLLYSSTYEKKRRKERAND